MVKLSNSFLFKQNRYLSIFYSAEKFKLGFKFSFLLIGICVLLGIFWAVLPIIGWSQYSLESQKTSCCIEWSSKSASTVSYNIALFLFVFILPLVIMTFTSFKMFSIVSIYLQQLKISTFLYEKFYIFKILFFKFLVFKTKVSRRPQEVVAHKKIENHEQTLTLNFIFLIRMFIWNFCIALEHNT